MMMDYPDYAKMSKSDKAYYTEMDVETLVKAAKIKNDKPRMKRALAKLREMRKEYAAVEGAS